MLELKILKSKEIFGESLIGQEEPLKYLSQKMGDNLSLNSKPEFESEKFIKVFKTQIIHQKTGSLTILIPKIDNKIIYEYGIKNRSIDFVNKANKEIQILELTLKEDEIIILPIGVIHKFKNQSGETAVFLKEEICYREMVNFAGTTILGLKSFEEDSFKEYDKNLLSGIETKNTIEMLKNLAQTHSMIVKLGKLKTSKNR